MKNLFILKILLLWFSSTSPAQNLPKCIQKLNSKTHLTTKSFERVLQLSGNRTVYEFAITSKRECIHCERGIVYYDANCNTVAYFMNTRGPSGFVSDGYTVADFGKSGFHNIRYGEKQEPIAACITKIIANSDSLKKAGVKKIVQVRIKENILYGFEHELDPKLVNCKDCAKAVVYYNEACTPEVTFRLGGIAGIKAEKGYTASNYVNRRILKILWNAN
ncbi:hypothetical protein [Pedobacter sp.]|uniref:hypothetical protein n=1 Tax=Pedobacter sp. TaxID=1411316 RepID=UPI003C4F8FD2